MKYRIATESIYNNECEKIVDFSPMIVELIRNLKSNSQIKVWWSEPGSAAQGGGRTKLEAELQSSGVLSRFVRTDRSWCNGSSSTTMTDLYREYLEINGEPPGIGYLANYLEDECCDLTQLDPYGIYSAMGYGDAKALADCIEFEIISDDPSLLQIYPDPMSPAQCA